MAHQRHRVHCVTYHSRRHPDPQWELQWELQWDPPPSPILELFRLSAIVGRERRKCVKGKSTPSPVPTHSRHPRITSHHMTVRRQPLSFLAGVMDRRPPENLRTSFPAEAECSHAVVSSTLLLLYSYSNITLITLLLLNCHSTLTQQSLHCHSAFTPLLTSDA